MAERRMFAKSITRSDCFLDMPLTTQALYFHLGMEADDDGFLGSAQCTMRMIGASKDDLSLLIAKGFVIALQNGVCVITHWGVNNYIRSDRYKETIYTTEKAMLCALQNGAYALKSGTSPALATVGIPSDNQTDTVGRRRLGKDRLDKDSVYGGKPPAHTMGEFGYVKLTDDEYEKLVAVYGEEEIKRLITYVDESAASTNNKNKWKNWYLVLRRAARDGWGDKGGQMPPRRTADEPEYQDLTGIGSGRCWDGK